jgi:head-tail adaptor
MSIYDTLKAATTPLMTRFKNPKGPASYERNVQVARPGGGYSTDWVSQGTFNVIVIPASGTEQEEAQRLSTHVSHKLLALFDDASGVTTKDRIVFNSRVFNVEFAGNIAEGDMWLKLMCMEGVAT